MLLSAYSVVMALLWFSLATLTGSLVLHKTMNGSLVFSVVVFLLALARIFIPTNPGRSIVIPSKRLYPFLQTLMKTRLSGEVTVGWCLLLLWAVGAALRLLWLAKEMYATQKFRIAAQPLDSDSKYLPFAQDICKELGYPCNLLLAVSPNASTAFQAGFFYPCILLPHNIDSFSDQDIRNMIRHELCHFLGWDLWIKLGVQLLTCVLWWNPVMILLNHSVEQLLELRCDRRACAGLEKAEQYAYLNTLLVLAKNSYTDSQTVSLGFLGNRENANLVQRFYKILHQKVTPKARAISAAGIVICITLFLASYCFILQPYFLPPIEEIEGSDIYVNAEDIYITRSPSNELILYQNGEFKCFLSDSDLLMEPYCKYIVYDIK